MSVRQSVTIALVVVALLLCATRPTEASPSSDAMATVKAMVDNFNKGDTAATVATCAPQTAIIDDFPPHTWQSCSAWDAALSAFNTAHGMTDGIETLGTPWHVDVAGNVAYVVVPTTYAYKVRGKPVTESGSVWTLVLRKTAAGWRITSWAWAAH